MTSAFLHLIDDHPGVARHLPLVVALQPLVEVLPVEEAHPAVAVGGAVVDPPDRQVEVERVEVALERQRVADLELPVLGELAADDAAGLVFLERLELVGRDRQLVVDR